MLGIKIGVAIAAFAAVASLGLATPHPANASTGCCVTLSEVVHTSSSLFLSTSEGAISDHAYRLKVGVVLKGAPPPAVIYRAVVGEPAMAPGSRWIIVTYPADGRALRTGVLNGRWDQAWPIAPDGRIGLPALVVAPASLSAFLAWFGLPATNMVGASEGVNSSTGVLVVLATCGALAFGLALLVRTRRGRQASRLQGGRSRAS